MARNQRLRVLSDDQLTEEVARLFGDTMTETCDIAYVEKHIALSRGLLEVARRQARGGGGAARTSSSPARPPRHGAPVKD